MLEKQQGKMKRDGREKEESQMTKNTRMMRSDEVRMMLQ